MYNKKVMEQFLNPKNMGEIKNADGVGKVGNMKCGDVMWLFIKIGNAKNKLVIKDIKFKTLGCAAAIATSSKVTELAKGKTISDALNITKSSIVDSLGGLPAPKIHCSVLAIDALKEAVYDYFGKHKIEIPADLEAEHKRIKRELNIAEHIPSIKN